MTYPE